jgi:hypothetical protein
MGGKTHTDLEEKISRIFSLKVSPPDFSFVFKFFFHHFKIKIVFSLFQIEVDTPSSELTEESLYDQVHPKKTIYRPKFAKPKGPAGRAPRSKKPAPDS